MRVAITGANGLLGHHVVHELLQRGDEVTVIVRSTNKLFFDTAKVHIIQGDFTEFDKISELVHNCDAVIHIAAVTSTDLLHYKDYEDVNVTATDQLIKAATAAGIRNYVFVSSANTIGYGHKKKPADESYPSQAPFKDSFYTKSKLEGENLFMELAADSENHVIIINPSFMIGKYDTKPSSGRLMLMGYKKRLMFVPGGGKNFVAASAVAAACCNALTMGVSGNRYLATGIDLSFRKFYKKQRKIGEYPQKLIKLPDFILRIAGWAGDLIRLMGIKTSLSTVNIKQLLVREYYSNKKARKDLKLARTDIDSVVLEALTWFKENDYIK